MECGTGDKKDRKFSVRPLCAQPSTGVAAKNEDFGHYLHPIASKWCINTFGIQRNPEAVGRETKKNDHCPPLYRAPHRPFRKTPKGCASSGGVGGCRKPKSFEITPTVVVHVLSRHPEEKKNLTEILISPEPLVRWNPNFQGL
jgi:hypothetical protein